MSELRPSSLPQRLGRCRILFESRCRHVRSACATRKCTRDGTIHDIRVHATLCCPDFGECNVTHVIVHVPARFLRALSWHVYGREFLSMRCFERTRQVVASTCARDTICIPICRPICRALCREIARLSRRPTCRPLCRPMCRLLCRLFCRLTRILFCVHALCSDMAADRRLLVAAVHTAFCRIPRRRCMPVLCCTFSCTMIASTIVTSSTTTHPRPPLHRSTAALPCR